MNKKIVIDEKWPFYCYTESDKTSGKYYAKWLDLTDNSYHESDRLIDSEKEALVAAAIGAEHTCGFKYKQEKDPEMQKIIDLIHGKTEE